MTTAHVHGEPSENRKRTLGACTLPEKTKFGICLGLLNKWKVGVFAEIPFKKGEVDVGLRTALAYLYDEYVMFRMDGNTDSRFKAHYIAVPLRLNTYVLERGLQHKAFLGVGAQVAYLLGGYISYNYDRGEQAKWVKLKGKNQPVEIKNWAAYFLVGGGYEYNNYLQVSIEAIRRLNTVVRCSNSEADFWFFQLGVSYNLASLF